MIADMLSNKKKNPTVTELFIRCRKLNIYLVVIKLSYFALPKKYQTKFYTLFYQNSKQRRALTNWI